MSANVSCVINLKVKHVFVSMTSGYMTLRKECEICYSYGVSLHYIPFPFFKEAPPLTRVYGWLYNIKRSTSPIVTWCPDTDNPAKHKSCLYEITDRVIAM